jgi:nucleoside-diphosphate-sugar epimerase
MKVLVTGAAGNAGQAVTRLLADEGVSLRLTDVAPPPGGMAGLGEFVRCDTRTPDDVRAAVAGMDAVIHLAAWHSAHQPPVSDATIFAVNVDGTFNVVQACRAAEVQALVFASSMAYGWGGSTR